MSETIEIEKALPPVLQEGIPFEVGGVKYEVRRLKTRDALRLLKIIETMLMKGGEEFSYHFPGQDPMDPAVIGKALVPILLAGVGASEAVLMAFLADTIDKPVVEFENLPLGVFPALINTLVVHPDLEDFFVLLRQEGGAMTMLQKWIGEKVTEATKKSEAVRNNLKKP